jgi:hypothetical protein
MKWLKITITQVDCFGPGKDRQFVQYVQERDLDSRMRSIHAAYNMAHTRVEVQ